MINKYGETNEVYEMDMTEIRQIGLRDNQVIKDAVRCILQEIGEDPDREGLERTPFRIAKAYEEWFGGYDKDPTDVLNRTFTEKSEMVIEGPIGFYSHCEHHMAPFYGKVWIGYIPSEYVTGLDKMIKLVEIYARRLQIQERLTSQIADAMFDNLSCVGVGVICKAYHLCVSSRETKNQDTYTTTSAIRGALEKKEVRDEFLSLIKVSE